MRGSYNIIYHWKRLNYGFGVSLQLMNNLEYSRQSMPATPACPRRHKSHIRPGHDGHGYSDFHANEFPISSDDSDHEKLKNMPVPPPMRESFPADKFSNRQQFANKGER